MCHVVRSNSLKAVGTLASRIQNMREKKRPCLCSQAALVQILALPLPTCVTLATCSNVSMAEFSHL